MQSIYKIQLNFKSIVVNNGISYPEASTYLNIVIQNITLHKRHLDSVADIFILIDNIAGYQRETVFFSENIILWMTGVYRPI